jgi:hypothetical protein
VHTFVSAGHAVPDGRFVYAHAPVTVLHASEVHGLRSLQSAFVVQHPATGVNTQPVAGLHESLVQMLASLQLIATCRQTAAASHTSFVQAFPSLVQPMPAGSGVRVHVPVATSHASVVQTFPSSQSAFVAQQPAIGANAHPVAGLHVSAVHTFPSSHAIAACEQSPDAALHVSVVQTLPSSH